MLNPLAPLRHVYDVEPPTPAGDAPPPADPVETALLSGMRRVLDARPAETPSRLAVEAVLDRAAARSAAHPAFDALGRALNAQPPASPSDAAVEAVLARAAAASSADQSVRDAYAATAALAGEAELLRQSRLVLDRAIASRPRSRPSADVEALILARAADASGVVRDVAPSDLALRPVAAAYGLATEAGVESSLLASTSDALARLPLRQPEAATLDAVLAQAALASAPVAPDAIPPRAPAADRAAVPLASRRTRGVWAGSAALLAAVVIAFLMVPSGAPSSDAEAVVAVAEPSAPEAEAAPALTPAEQETPAAPQPAPALAAAVPAPRVVQRTAPRGPSASEFTPVQAVRPAPPPVAASARSAPDGLSDEVAAAPTSVPSWDVDDDVRLLSLRLQELRRQNQGLAWDESAEAFGAPADAAGGSAGIQVVREGAAPARAQIRVRADSARSNR